MRPAWSIQPARQRKKDMRIQSKQLQEKDSLPVEHRGRDKSLHRKKEREQETLTD